MDLGRSDHITGPAELAHSTGWVARRLGVTPSTLRTWHRRYRVGPTGRSTGGHGRYLPEDVRRLDRMLRLMLAGVPTAEAADLSADPRSSSPASAHAAARPPDKGYTPQRANRQVRRLTEAAVALDQLALEPLLAGTLRRRGVVMTWNELLVPALTRIGEHFADGGGCIAAEHLLTESVRAALTAVVARRQSWDDRPPVLLACPDQERHCLPLHALGATLAETGCSSRILGASVPADELALAARQVAPRAVFVWSQIPATARPTDLQELSLSPGLVVVVGGPGWQGQVVPPSVVRVDSLVDAAAAVSGACSSDDESASQPLH